MRTWRGNPWAGLITLSLGFFMTLLDLTIVNIAIPKIIDDLHASLDHVLWVLNAYVLVLAVLLITFGRLGDLLGQRRVFIAGVALFTVASMLCGIAPGAGALIAARAVQGVGAAALIPQTMAIIVATFPAERRGAAMGVWGAVAGLSTVAGPTLGGLLITAFSWRWIFFINVPIGALVLVCGVFLLPDLRLGRRHRLDWPGVVIVTGALFCLTFALTEGQRYAWDGLIWALLTTGLLLTGVFFLQQRRRQDREPLMPLELFRSRGFSVMSIVGAAVSIGVIGFFLPFTIYLQSVLGFSALQAGLVLAPSSVASMLVAPIAGRLSDRIGGDRILFCGLTLFAAGLGWIVAVSRAGTGWPALMAPLLIMGIGMGATFAPMATEALRGIPPRLAGAASGVNNTIRQVGSVIGSASVGALLQARLVHTLPEQAALRAGELPPALRGGFLQGFRQVGHAGLQVGAGQTGASGSPGGVPASAAQAVQRVGGQVFHHGYVQALQVTLLLPGAVIVLAALICLVAGRRRPVARPMPALQEPLPAGVAR